MIPFHISEMQPSSLGHAGHSSYDTVTVRALPPHRASLSNSKGKISNKERAGGQQGTAGLLVPWGSRISFPGRLLCVGCTVGRVEFFGAFRVRTPFGG